MGLLAENYIGRKPISEVEAEYALDDDRCYLIVATDETDIVGILSAYRFPDVVSGGGLVYLYDIEVERRNRKSGIGRAMIQRLLDICKSDNVAFVWAGTDVSNKSARILFERTGAYPKGESYAEYEWSLQK